MNPIRHFIKDTKSKNSITEQLMTQREIEKQKAREADKQFWIKEKQRHTTEMRRLSEEDKQHRIARDIKHREEMNKIHESVGREPTWREELGWK